MQVLTCGAVKGAVTRNCLRKGQSPPVWELEKSRWNWRGRPISVGVSIKPGRRSPVFVSCGSGSAVSSTSMMMEAKLEPKQVLVPIANGTEEMEAVIIADVLRRAGADVTIASVEDDIQIVASRNVKLIADTSISSCAGSRYDLIVLPGGMPGAANLRDSSALRKMVESQVQRKSLVAAICAAPAVALGTWGLLAGVKATCHPSFTDMLDDSSSAESRVVRDGLVTTSRGPGTCFEFALSLVEQLYGKEKLDEVSKPLVLRATNDTMASVQEYNREDWASSGAPKPFRVLVPIANGSEEMEVVIIVDVLRRAGFEVNVASVEDSLQIVASRKVKIAADISIKDVAALDFDIIILPGGLTGSERLRDCDTLSRIMRNQVDAKKILGAICAAPAVVLEPKELLKGKKATSFPSFQSSLPDQTAVGRRVVIDGRLVTSQAPGTCMEFALSIVEKVLGQQKASGMAEAMVLPYL